MTIADMTLAEAAHSIASGELTPFDLTEACLRRAEQADDEILAWVTVDGDRALSQARALTDELRRGTPRSPLHGIPAGIKDIIDVADLPTTAGSRVLERTPAAADAPVVVRVRDAGAVIMGKTNTQEFAYGVVTSPTRNPWRHDCIPGGSSGGSAAALAAGMCLAAVGTDTAGSIRIPAALCGISGLKPRPGIVPLDGIVPLAPTLDVCGPMARTAEDLALMWGVMAASTAERPGEIVLGVPDSYAELLELDPEVEAAVEDAIAALEADGTPRTRVQIPPFKQWDFPRAVPLMVEALVVHKEAGWWPERAESYSEDTAAALRYAEDIGAETLAGAYKSLEELTARLLSAFDGASVLVLPSTPITAPTVDESQARDDGHRPPITRTLTRICGPINWCGLAAAAVPCGFSRDGLPIGVQFVARDEATALAAATRYQQVTDWHTARPPVPKESSDRQPS